MAQEPGTDFVLRLTPDVSWPGENYPGGNPMIPAPEWLQAKMETERSLFNLIWVEMLEAPTPSKPQSRYYRVTSDHILSHEDLLPIAIRAVRQLEDAFLAYKPWPPIEVAILDRPDGEVLASRIVEDPRS